MSRDGYGRPRYLPGEAVTHARFGDGIIIRETDGLIEVMFADGPRRLTLDSPDLRRKSHPPDERVYPEWAEIRSPDRFVPALTPGERDLVEFMDARLPGAWRIYVRPHLHGDLPSLALLHPTHGGMLWDVIEGISDDDDLAQALPVAIQRTNRKLEAIRTNIYGTLMPDLAERVLADSRNVGTIRLGIYALAIDTSAVQASALAWRHLQVLGGADAENRDVLAMLPTPYPRLTPSEFNRLDQHFRQYYQRLDPMATVTLDPRQREIAGREPGRREVVGVAGSGKTLILAQRAAITANRGGTALIVTFNRTLANYIRGIQTAVPVIFRSDRITIQHIHGLCALLSRDAGLTYDGENDATLSARLERDWPKQLVAHYGQLPVPPHLRFDSILIDEAQDMSDPFLDVLQLLLRTPDSDQMAAVDRAQRLYARESPFGTAKASRFGRETRLTTGYRVSRAVGRTANSFAAQWQLDTVPIEEPLGTLGLGDGNTAWIDVENDQIACVEALTIVESRLADGVRPDQIVVLVPSREHGAALVRMLAVRRVAANHLFLMGATGAPMDGRVAGRQQVDAPPSDRLETWAREISLKKAFAYGDQRLKVSTVHSYKGWECDHLIYVLPDQTDVDEQTARLAYVALTRSRDTATFLGRESGLKLSDFTAYRSTAVVDREAQREFAAEYAEAKRWYAASRKRMDGPPGQPPERAQDGPPDLEWPTWGEDQP